MCYGLGDYKSPGLIGRTFFTTDFKSVGTPNGGMGLKDFLLDKNSLNY